MQKIQVWGRKDVDGEIDYYSYNLHVIEDPEHTTAELTDNETKQKLGSYFDDGDGLAIKLGNKKLNLNYSEAAELLILLMHNIDNNYEFRETKIIKSF